MEQNSKIFSYTLEGLDWFNLIEVLFTKLAQPINNSVLKYELLAELTQKVTSLDKALTPKPHTGNQLLSLEGIVNTINPMSLYVSWDEVLDALIKSQTNCQNTVPVTSEGIPSRVLKSTPPLETASLNLSCCSPKISTVPPGMLFKGLQYLSLSGNSISHTKWEFPKGLIVLDLSSNEISEFSFVAWLNRLRFLNLSRNKIIRIVRVATLKRLTEISLSSNSLPNMNSLSTLLYLKLIDFSDNAISSLSALSPLKTLNSLKSVKFEGNPIAKHVNYASTVKYSTPPGCIIDPVEFKELSEFTANVIAFPRTTQPNLVPTSPRILSSYTGNSHRTNRQLTQNQPATPKHPTNTSSRRTSSSSSIVITKELIADSAHRTYNNPVKAVMISFVPRVRRVSSSH